jgi:hypothetical protein
MNVVSSVEQYLIFELVASFEMVVSWIKGDQRDRNLWSVQVKKLKKAIHWFMLDLDVKEFKELKLPSEVKPKSKPQSRSKSPRPRLGRKVRNGGKQLQLFFTATLKRTLLITVLLVEFVAKKIASRSRPQDYENRRMS